MNVGNQIIAVRRFLGNYDMKDMIFRCSGESHLPPFPDAIMSLVLAPQTYCEKKYPVTKNDVTCKKNLLQ